MGIVVKTPAEGALFALGAYALTFVISLLVGGMVWLMVRLLHQPQKAALPPEKGAGAPALAAGTKALER